MKKILFILGIAISSISFAQEVSYGVHGGLNNANTNFKVSEGILSIGINTDPRTSFYFGGFAEFSLPNMEHKLQTGLSLNFNGFKLSDSEPEFYEEEISIRIAQLNIPILFKFNALEGLYINGGAYLGAILQVEGEYKGTDFFNNESFSETETITDNFSTIDFGLSVGAEYNLDSGLFFELRYNIGLVDITNNNADSDFESVEIKNRFLMFGLGYKF